VTVTVTYHTFFYHTILHLIFSHKKKERKCAQQHRTKFSSNTKSILLIKQGGKKAKRRIRQEKAQRKQRKENKEKEIKEN
jgi:hypothetical protein